MPASQSDEDLRYLTHLLLDAPDAAAAIALACLQTNHDGTDDRRTTIRNAPAEDRRQDDPEQRKTKVRLKPIERDVVAWVAAGKSYADIATILNLPYGTVRYHLDKARRRNGFHTVTQFVVHAACDYDMCPLEPGSGCDRPIIPQSNGAKRVSNRRSP